MNKIIIAGLGPGNKDLLPIRTLELLQSTPRLFLRTARHPITDDLVKMGIAFESFDSIYDRAGDFGSVYDEIVAAVLDAAASTAELVYAVPGHPMVAEKTVEMLSDSAAGRFAVEIWPAMSCLEAVYTALHLNPTRGLLIWDCLDPDRLDTRTPSLGLQLYSRHVASDVKLTLMEQYPDDHPVKVVRAASVPGEEKVWEIPLFELDRLEELDHLTTLFVPPIPSQAGSAKEHNRLSVLESIMEKLRGPGGCPWDREQDHQSLKRYLVEETYEVIEAVDEGDMHKLQEELGDLLLQIVFHAQIAKEEGQFDMDGVIGEVSEKLIRRHPHVFGDAENVNCAEDVNVNWERIKHREKRDRPRFDVPRQLPALMRAEKIQKKAAEVGFDWSDVSGAWMKIDEELQELNAAVASGSNKAVMAEVGDLLFAVVNVARFLRVDPEEALSAAISKFIHRFAFIEDKLAASGAGPEEATLEQMEAYWQESKRFIT